MSLVNIILWMLNRLKSCCHPPRSIKRTVSSDNLRNNLRPLRTWKALHRTFLGSNPHSECNSEEETGMSMESLGSCNTACYSAHSLYFWCRLIVFNPDTKSCSSLNVSPKPCPLPALSHFSSGTFSCVPGFVTSSHRRCPMMCYAQISLER